MPHSAPSRQPPTVFISYAHESDALRASVAALAGWLRGHGCRVFTDHPYVDRPPPQGWLAWMLGCIEEADTALVVCTPKLKGRYEKTAAPDAGRGATYEGAIVTLGLAEYIDLLTALDDLSEAGSPGGRSAEQRNWLERLSAYALVKNAEQPQDRAPISPPAEGENTGP